MLSNEKNDLMYLLNILESIGKIEKYTENANDAESFYELNDQLNLNASLNLLANIGENVSKISDTLKQEYQNIKWRQMKDFRNVIVHNYIGIDLVIVYDVIKNDLVEINKNIIEIIKTKMNQKIFDSEEINVCKGNQYYKYVHFEEIM